jgi:hypothetical protein
MFIKIRVIGNDLTIITSSMTLEDTQVEKFDLNPGAGWDSKASEKVSDRIVDHIESMISFFLGPEALSESKENVPYVVRDAHNEPVIIEEGVKDIMLGVLCALGISCSSMMTPPNTSPDTGPPWGGKPLNPWWSPAWGTNPKAFKRSPTPHIRTSPRSSSQSVDPTTPDVPKQMNQAKPDETFGAAWKKFIEPHLLDRQLKIKSPEEVKVITKLAQKEIETWFNENSKVANRLVEIKDETNDVLNIILNWGPEPEHGWPGWNEVMKEVERAIAQPK